MKKVTDGDWILAVRPTEGDDGYSFSGYRSEANLTEFERWLWLRRAEVDVLGASSRDVSYAYDEVAAVHLDGRFGWAETSGCSCPSPSETWSIVECTAEELRANIAKRAAEMATDDYYNWDQPVPADKCCDVSEMLAALDAIVGGAS